MLLFGGSLSGSEPSPGEATPSPSAATSGSPPSLSLSPHSDVLHRLTNHELRLLEELERTRSKLQAEWRLKVADLQRQQPDAVGAINVALQSPSTVDELVQRFSIPRELIEGSLTAKAASSTSNQRSPKPLPHKKTRWKQTQRNRQEAAPGSLPRILRSTQNMMPVLTTTGETPFEVGLAPASCEPHVLPIFRLPTVNVNGAARALAASAVETIQEDQDRKLASEALGLSMDEIAQLEAKLNGREGDSRAAHQTNQVATGRGASYTSKPHPVQPTGEPWKKTRERGCRQVSAVSKKPKHGRKLSRSDSLRSELESALYNVQHLTQLVKIDIASAQKICPASDLRTTVWAGVSH